MSDIKPYLRERDTVNAPKPYSSTGQEPETFYLPIYVLTAVFGAIFIIGPIAVRKGPYIGIIRCSIMISAFCMWIFWVTMYIAQMNPLMGPRLHNTSMAWIGYAWGNDPEKVTLKARRIGEDDD